MLKIKSFLLNDVDFFWMRIILRGSMNVQQVSVLKFKFEGHIHNSHASFWCSCLYQGEGFFLFFRYIYNIQMFKVFSMSPVMRRIFIYPFCYDFFHSQLSSLWLITLYFRKDRRRKYAVLILGKKMVLRPGFGPGSPAFFADARKASFSRHLFSLYCRPVT